MRIVRSPMSFSAGWLLTAFLLGLTGPAHAGDGVIEINQAKAEAGGVTPGDTEGFPVTISESGSYRLTGNLTVPDENTTGIEITADDVTLDLNGFAIEGPTVCSGNPLSCSPTGSGDGVFSTSANTNITVVNGTIRGMGDRGITLPRNPTRVEHIHATSNGGIGILAAGIVTGSTAGSNGGAGIFLLGGLATGNDVRFNGGNGISCDGATTVTGNTVHFNNDVGISVLVGTVAGNTVFSNGGKGITVTGTGSVVGNTVRLNGGFQPSGFQLSLSSNVGYSDNVIQPGVGASTVSGGVVMGKNVCNGNTTCP